jgi:hypothetical protein
MFITPQAVLAATGKHPVKRNEEGALENEMAITLMHIDREYDTRNCTVRSSVEHE